MSPRAGAVVALSLFVALAAAPALAQDKRPFAEGGVLEVPEGDGVRMGDAKSGLTIVAAPGSAIKKEGLALALLRGRMGVGLSNDPTGRRAMRVVADKVIVQSTGGKFVVERTDGRIVVKALEGKVLTAVNKGPTRALSGWQQLVVAGKAAPKVEGVKAEEHKADSAWIGPLGPAPEAPPAAAPKKPARKRRSR